MPRFEEIRKENTEFYKFKEYFVIEIGMDVVKRSNKKGEIDATDDNLDECDHIEAELGKRILKYRLKRASEDCSYAETRKCNFGS